MLCSICHESLLSGRPVALKCGHVYHKECVFVWIESRRSCPTCRKKVSVSDCLPVFLENQKNSDIGNDTISLATELAKVQEALERETYKRAELQGMVDAARAEANMISKARDELAQKLRDRTNLFNQSHAQLDMYRKRFDELTRQTQELKKMTTERDGLLTKLHQYRAVEACIAKSQVEIDLMMSRQNCQKTMAMMVVNLKRELVVSETKRTNLRATNTDLNKLLKIANEKNLLLEKDVKELARKIVTITTATTRTSSRESTPASTPTRSNEGAAAVPLVETTNHPAGAPSAVVSPYLRLQSSAVGLTPIMRTGYAGGSDNRRLSENLQRLSIFNSRHLRLGGRPSMAVALRKENVAPNGEDQRPKKKPLKRPANPTV